MFGFLTKRGRKEGGGKDKHHLPGGLTGQTSTGAALQIMKSLKLFRCFVLQNVNQYYIRNGPKPIVGQTIETFRLKAWRLRGEERLELPRVK